MVNDKLDQIKLLSQFTEAEQIGIYIGVNKIIVN